MNGPSLLLSVRTTIIKMENHLKTSGESLEYKTKDSLAANMEMSQECAQVFQDLKLRKKHRYIIYKMGQETFEIDVIGERKEVFSLNMVTILFLFKKFFTIIVNYVI